MTPIRPELHGLAPECVPALSHRYTAHPALHSILVLQTFVLTVLPVALQFLHMLFSLYLVY